MVRNSGTHRTHRIRMSRSLWSQRSNAFELRALAFPITVERGACIQIHCVEVVVCDQQTLEQTNERDRDREREKNKSTENVKLMR